MSGSPEQPEAVVMRLAEDVDAGFAELVRGYQKIVYSVALRVSGPGDAEDLAAESFLRAYSALLRYDRERILALRPRPWLLTIVLNTWRNSVRDSSRQPGQMPLSEASDMPGGEPSVEEIAEGAETRRHLAELVAELPAPQRVAVVLRHVVGLPIAEIAAVIGCPDGTAKSHVSRGLRGLRTLYQARGPDRADLGTPRPGNPGGRLGSRRPPKSDVTSTLAARRER